MDKKNLLLIVPTLQLGGQERVAVNTAEILSDCYNIIFVVFDGKDAVYAPKCEVLDLAIPARPSKFTKIRNALHRALKLYRIKRNRHIDFALSFGTTANLANVLSGHKGTIVINLREFGGISRSLINRITYHCSDTIICCAQEMRTALNRIYPSCWNKTACLYNPYNVEWLLQQGSQPVKDYVFSPHTIITHGRLDEVKNYPRLIKAFSLVQKQILDAQLLIIGEGCQRAQLESLVKAYHLENCVTLIGFRNNPFAYLAKSSLYVMSSYSEGFPNALVEGMVFLPTISVDCKTGPREILCNGPIENVTVGWEEVNYGILVQPAKNREFCQELTQDDRCLADAIISVLLDNVKAKELQAKAQSRVAEYSYEVYRKTLSEILEH